MMVALSLKASAGSVETVLWNDTYVDGVELNAETVATFEAGNILRVYVTVPEGGANFKIVYKGAPEWSETTIPSIDNQWPWVSGGETYKDFTLTDADITALAGKNIYIYKGDNSTITKVSLITEVEIEDAEKIKWTGSEPVSWNPESVPGTQYETPAGTFTGLKAGDVVRIYSTVTEGDYGDPQYVVTYKKGEKWEWTNIETTVSNGVIRFAVADETQATEIAERGLILRGQAWTATKITVNDFTTMVLRDTELPTIDAGTYGKVKVSRTLLAGFNTIIVPFATTAEELTGSATAYAASLKEANDAGDVLTFIKVNDIAANKPYLIYVESDTDLPTLSDKELVALENYWDWQTWDRSTTDTRWYMQGVYEPQSATGKYVISGENSMAIGGSSATIKGLRAYITNNSGASVKANITFSIDDSTTGIKKVVDAGLVHGLIFNVAGQRQNTLKKGVNIVDGKKIVIK